LGRPTWSRACFPTPPSEPAVQVSLQRALQGVASIAGKTGFVMFFTFIAASIILRDSRLTSNSGDTRQLLDQNNVTPLPPFAMWLAFPTSDYYDGSDSWIRHRWTVHLHILIQVSHVRMDVLRRDNVGAGFQTTNPALRGIPCGDVVIQVTRLIL
jgi:hypothetical protein